MFSECTGAVKTQADRHPFVQSSPLTEPGIFSVLHYKQSTYSQCSNGNVITRGDKWLISPENTESEELR